MGYWEYYKTYKRKSPKAVKDGLKTKKRTGKIGGTWWSRRWIDVLESFHIGNRLARGRSYARAGQVISIDVGHGKIIAEVQGSRSRPYKVVMNIKVISETDWHTVLDVMAKQALFAAKLLAGEMPQNIEQAFSAAKISLFPTSLREIDTNCSCPDWANPCKHIAAVYYLLAERFDEDPFLIFKMRGKSKQDIINELRKKRTGVIEPEKQNKAARDDKHVGMKNKEPSEARIDKFWTCPEELDKFSINIPKEWREINDDKECYILKMLNDFPIDDSDLNRKVFDKIFKKIYKIAAMRAFKVISKV